jgi:hypothetical protein
MTNIKHLMYPFVFFSLFAIAEESTTVELKDSMKTGSEIEAHFTRLSPQAIELGLRDVTLLGKVKDPKDTDQKHDIEWHSITKTIDGTTKAKQLDEVLYSNPDKPKAAGDEVLVNGDLNRMLTAFSDMLAESKADTDEMTEIGIEKDAESSPLSSGSMAGGSGSTSADVNEEEFQVETDKYTVKVEQCDLALDFNTGIASEMERSLKVSDTSGDTLETGACKPTGKTYAIQKDYDAESCADLPNYLKSEIYFGYKFFINKKETDKEYVSSCKNDLENATPIFQDISTCTTNENLTENLATITKKWHFTDPTTKQKTYFTDCMETEETYPIVVTEETCSPTYLSDINKVIITNRKGWMNQNNEWNFVTECRASEVEKEILVEICDAPKYEHDFVGGQSYLRSRDYYLYNDEKNYLNGCSRDTTKSFPHQENTKGCTIRHDDANLRSQMSSGITAVLEEGETQLKECAASGGYSYYVPLGTTTLLKETRSGHCGISGGARTLASMFNTYHTKSYGTPQYQPSSSSRARTVDCQYNSGGGNGNSPGGKQTTTLTVTENRYQRVDGSQVNLRRSVILK